MKNDLIKITGLRKSYGKNEVLKGIDINIKEEEVVVVIGPSGGGKSTFLRCINYLEVPTGGEIVFDGIPLNGEANINEVRKEIGMVFQRFNLFPHMTVMENLILAPMKVRSVSRMVFPASRAACWSMYPTFVRRAQVILPSSGDSFPVMIDINVDLPSPLAPTRATCSPFSRRKETSSKISRPP